jgi:hypothetical protein
VLSSCIRFFVSSASDLVDGRRRLAVAECLSNPSAQCVESELPVWTLSHRFISNATLSRQSEDHPVSQRALSDSHITIPHTRTRFLKPLTAVKPLPKWHSFCQSIPRAEEAVCSNLLSHCSAHYWNVGEKTWHSVKLRAALLVRGQGKMDNTMPQPHDDSGSRLVGFATSAVPFRPESDVYSSSAFVGARE